MVLCWTPAVEGPDKALGETGRTHDWRISHRVCDTVQVPVFLAGGLRLENVAETIRQGVRTASISVRACGQMTGLTKGRSGISLR